MKTVLSMNDHGIFLMHEKFDEHSCKFFHERPWKCLYECYNNMKAILQ